MKNFTRLSSVLISITILIYSCAKDPVVGGNKPVITLTKSSLNIAEHTLAISTGQASGTTVRWSTNINGHIWTSPTTDSATLVFANPGSYQLTATYVNSTGLAYDSSYATISVQNTTDTAGTHFPCEAVTDSSLIAGEEIDIVPIDYSDTGLVFVATTKSNYHNSALLKFSGNLNGTGDVYSIDFESTLHYVCYGSDMPGQAFGIISFSSVTVGNYNLIIHFNETAYEGSLNVTAQTITIAWTSSTGVKIAPLTISKR